MAALDRLSALPACCRFSGVHAAVGDAFNEVRQHSARVLIGVVHRQAVFFGACDDGKERTGRCALNLECEAPRLVDVFEAAGVVKRAVQIDLGSQQAKGVVWERKAIHTARPPLFGSNGAGRLLFGTSLGLWLWRMIKQPVVICSCSISRRLLAHVGWMCRVAVVCMVLPRSVVKSETNINQWLICVNHILSGHKQSLS